MFASRHRLWATLAVGSTACLVSTGCSATAGPAAPAPLGSTHVSQVTISVSQCGTGWTRPVAGRQHFVLDNTDTRTGEVLLTDAGTGAVFADVEPLAAGTRTSLDIDLGSGRYAFRCAMEDEATVIGKAVIIPGTAAQPVAPVLAVTQADLIGATKDYERYVSGQIPRLTRLTGKLRAAIKDGDRPAARKAWLAAHLEYERLGAAYQAFGDLDTEINGLPTGRPGGVHDPGWSGFHRIEYGLWHGQSLPALYPSARALTTATTKLGHQFATTQIDPLQLSIRGHEIAENALQFELTGQSDFGSGSGLATTRANLDGTRTVLAILRPLLRSRYTQLPALNQALIKTENDLDAVRSAGKWPAPDELSRPDRERLNSDLGQLCELLAPVASILEPRRT